MRDRPRQMEIIDAIVGGAQRPRQVGGTPRRSTLSVTRVGLVTCRCGRRAPAREVGSHPRRLVMPTIDAAPVMVGEMPRPSSLTTI